MTLGCLAAGCSLANRPDLQCGAIKDTVRLQRKLTPLVPGPYVDSKCSEGHHWSCLERGRCMHTTCSSWLVVRGLASPLASYLLTPACVGTPAGNAGSGNQSWWLHYLQCGGIICKFTCIVRLLSSLAVINGGW